MAIEFNTSLTQPMYVLLRKIFLKGFLFYIIYNKGIMIPAFYKNANYNRKSKFNCYIIYITCIIKIVCNLVL